uniref:CSON015483 protein n=1 Tax=Culicoides sonorensis TaxID=179676 RepID=A0A336KT48_CULSO
MSEILNTPATALKLFYQNYKTTYGFDKSLAEYFESHPNENKEFASSEGEESDMTASSSDERDINSDTASAESPGNQNNKENSTSTSMKELLIPEKDNRLIPPLNQPPKRQKIQEEYDSSATETADEENESSPANRQSPKVIHYPFSSLSNGPRSDSNVRDIIGNVIEKAIKEQSIGLMPPVAKIITCPADSKSEITFIKEYRNESSRTISHVKSDNFSTVSIDIPERTGQNIKNSFVSTTITPVIQKGSQFSSNSNNKTDLEPQTLDLSVKKTRDHFASPGLIQSHGIMMYRDSAVSTGQIQVSHAQALTSQSQNFSSFNSEGRTNKSPLSFQAVSVPVSPTQQQSMSSMKNLTQSVSQSQSGCKTKMVQKLSPKTSQNQQVSTMKGSITHGTPVSSTSAMLSSPNSRYDNIFRQTPPIDKCGSITQGTPVSHIVGAQFPDKRMYDYFKSNRQSPASMTSQSTSPQSGSFGNMFNRSVAFTDNAQLSSKQILLNDYITSQQMIGRGNRTEKDIQRGSQSVSTSPATIYYNEKERNRTEYINRTSPADRNSVLSPQHSSSPQRQETPENLRRSHPIKGNFVVNK